MLTHPVSNRSELRSYPFKHSPRKQASRLWLRAVKVIVACAVVAFANIANAQKTDAKPTLVPGSEVNLSAITGADWIQGEGPTAFEPGKVYVFECWATWCGPCVALIPHVNELHKKYYDQGLRVHGMNSWEEDKDKAVDYVKAKGAGMSYPVAFTNESAFETEWLTAAGVEEIPHAFVVRNGKLLLATNAVRLTDSLVELILSGDEGAKKAVAIIKSAHDGSKEADKLYQPIYFAKIKGDAEKMAALINQVKTLDPNYYQLDAWNLELLMVRKDWPAAIEALNQMPSFAKTSFVGANQLASQSADAYPMSFTKAITAEYAIYTNEKADDIGPGHFASLAILYSRIGDKEKALIAAEKSLETAVNFKFGASEFRTIAYKRFVKAVKAGNIPKRSDVDAWSAAARNDAKQKAAKAAEVEPKAK